MPNIFSSQSAIQVQSEGGATVWAIAGSAGIILTLSVVIVTLKLWNKR